MGKHSKKVNCGMCNGTGKQKVGDNGRVREVTCSGCNGTGKV